MLVREVCVFCSLQMLLPVFTTYTVSMDQVPAQLGFVSTLWSLFASLSHGQINCKLQITGRPYTA